MEGSSVANLRNRLELAHIRSGPAQPIRRPSSSSSSIENNNELPADLPGNLPAILPPSRSLTKKHPPPPPPSAPPRKPSAPSPPPPPHHHHHHHHQSPVEVPAELPISPTSKLEERRTYERMEEQAPSSPPPYAPPLPSRQNSNIIITPTQPLPPTTTLTQQRPPPPPQLPPRLPPRPAPKPKAELSFAYSLLKKKPAAAPPPRPGAGRSLPPPVIPPPVPKGTWGTQKEEPEARRPSVGPSRPIQPPPPPPPLPITPRPEPAEPPNAGPVPSLPPRKSLPNLRPLPTATLPIPPLPKRTPSQPLIEPVQVEEPPLPRRNILSMGFGGKQGKLPSPPRTPQPESRPPPVPISSRPPAINTGTKPVSNGGPPPLPAARPGTSMPPNNNNHQPINTTCLKCRDFSHVDAHAARFPRHAYDDVQRLALDLTRPFGSDTDKARVLFTWLHHNIRYDVENFFNGTVQPSTPASVLRTGLAVCEGFAGLFAAMAMYSGLEAIVVGGHGKGFGWSGPNAGPMPPGPTGHAWNAVRIDNGVWQTIDPCWGAGHLCGGEYKQVFSPHHFTNTNEEFRKTHFPENPNHQFCAQPITWREYYHMEEGPQLYGTISEPDYNYGRDTVEPGVKVLQPHTRYRFRIAGPCEHKAANSNWVLMINNGQDEETMMPDGRGGYIADMTTGGSGSKVDLRVLTMFNKQSAKGMTIEKWKNKRGANSWSYSGLCMWEVK